MRQRSAASSITSSILPKNGPRSRVNQKPYPNTSDQYGAPTAFAECLLYEAVSAFISQKAPGFNWWGIAILGASLVVNPFLAWGKYRYGKRLDAPALKYDAKDTMICQYQTIVVLAGIGLTQWMGWWWADPVAALLIVPYVAWEAFEATKDARSVEPEEADATADA
nr:cation transporter [Pelagivirga sediminicola]